ncbi:MAG: C40 family peptidase, partial [Nocardioidaceae bacterium]
GSAAPHTAARPATHRLIAHAAVVAVVLVASVVLVGPRADASTRTSQRVMKVAASKKGVPYRWGANGPGAFDCSGYTRWVFARVGKRLPRTSRAQARATRHISRSARRPGDLVFFGGRSGVYHVGIYAGHNTMWHSPYTGRRVSRERIWTSNVRYGRVR